MEPWEEALDLDDSDIPSLLRPCKRLHHHHHHQQQQPPISSAALSQPTLQPCSNRPQTLINEVGAEEEESVHHQNSCPDSTERRRIIPGPAGAVQSAMLQKSRDREKQRRQLFCSQSSNVDPISTQEYMRRAVENAPEFDDDFSSNPWLSALHFIGTVEGVVPSVPLNSISQCANDGKVDQVVAVIKSCTQSSLGGLMVTLKDPTGTIGASVHQAVLGESQFAKDFCIGSVLILQKVAIFSPSRTVHYLNVMPRNLVKVFNKNNGPAKHNSLASVKYVAPGEECFGKGRSPKKMLNSENGSSEEMIEGMQQNPNGGGSLVVNEQTESGNLLSQSLTCSSGSGLKGNPLGEEPLTLRQDAANGLFEEAVPEKTTCDKQRFSLDIDNDRQLKVGNISERLQGTDVMGSFVKDHVQEIQEETRIQKQRQQLITAALPQWTDEQLEELFAGHDEDDGSFF